MKKSIYVIIFLIILVIMMILLKNNVKYEQTIDNVQMRIKEGTVTNSSAVIIITDGNKVPYIYNTWYQIEKKDGDIWKKCEIRADNYMFTEQGIGMPKTGEMEVYVDWSKYYGRLENGEYRIIKHVYVNNEYENISANFKIE